MKSGRVLAIRRSNKKGVPKEELESGQFIEGFGLEGDLHGGQAGRQVTLMGIDTIRAIKKTEIKGICTRKFVETITTEGIDLWKIKVGACIGMGETKMRITKVGKECFPACPIREQGAPCLLLTRVVFADVVQGGFVKTGDSIIMLDGANADDETMEVRGAMNYRVGIIVASDKGSRGQRLDRSGEVIREMMESRGYAVIEKRIVPDEFEVLKEAMIEMADEKKLHLILSTGGTGFSPRDVTPEATMAVIDRETPGIAEAMRQASLAITPKAMLSRGRAGIRKRTLIINLPGSPKAVKENLEVVLAALKHGLDILNENDAECARPMNAENK